MDKLEKHASTALPLPGEEQGKAVPVAQVEEVKSSINEVMPLDDDDDDLLIDEGGDFFWLLQNVVWGTIKSIFIILVLGFIIWLIWGKAKPSNTDFVDSPSQTISQPVVDDTAPKDISEEKKSWFTSLKEKWGKEKETEVPKDQVENTRTETPPSPREPVTSQPKNIPSITKEIQPIIRGEVPTKEIVDWHLYLEKKRLFDFDTTSYDGLQWIGQAQSIYAQPLSKHISGSNEYERRQQLESFLSHLNKLLGESYTTRTKLYSAKQEYAQKAEYAQIQGAKIQTALSAALAQNQGPSVPFLREQKAEMSKSYTFNHTNDELHTWLIARIEQYDKSLRGMYEVIFANQSAIIKDVRVVNFPQDPFERVLTPAQWREGG